MKKQKAKPATTVQESYFSLETAYTKLQQKCEALQKQTDETEDEMRKVIRKHDKLSPYQIGDVLRLVLEQNTDSKRQLKGETVVVKNIISILEKTQYRRLPNVEHHTYTLQSESGNNFILESGWSIKEVIKLPI